MEPAERLASLVAGDRHLTGAQLAARVLRAASGFAALGVAAGDRVALLLGNEPAFVEATLALQRLGAFAVPLNWHARVEETAHVLRDCGARVLVARPELLGDDLRASLDGVTVQSDWDGWVAASPPYAGPPAVATDSLIYTSGTSGLPKGVLRAPATPDQQRIVDRIRTEVYAMEPGGGARALVSAPLYHAAPNQFALRALRTGELLVVEPRFDPAATLAAVERHRITHVYAVPTMFVRLLALPSEVRARHDLSSLRHVVHIGAPCPVDVKRSMIDWLGPIVTDYYGSTELGPVTVCTSADWLAHPGSVGRPVTGARVAVLDDDGRELPAGQVGEICAANAGYPDFTYVGMPAARAELQRGELVASGDLGYLDADGFLYLCDRKRDLVISGGVNIYPAEVEAVLAGVPGVADSAVFGIPDPDLGEVLAAVVQPEPASGLTVDAVHAALAALLPTLKRPRHVELRAGLPREDSGKIRKRLLRDPFWEGAGRAI